MFPIWVELEFPSLLRRCCSYCWSLCRTRMILWSINNPLGVAFKVCEKNKKKWEIRHRNFSHKGSHVKQEDHNHLQTKNWRNRALKKEIEKRLGCSKKKKINVGLRAPCVGFTALHFGLHTAYTTSSRPNTQEHPRKKFN